MKYKLLLLISLLGMMISSCGTSTTEISSKDSPLLPETALSETTAEDTTESVFSEETDSETISETNVTTPSENPLTPDDNIKDNPYFLFRYSPDLNVFLVTNYFGEEERLSLPKTHRSLPVILSESFTIAEKSREQIKELYLPDIIAQTTQSYSWIDTLENLENIEIESNHSSLSMYHHCLYDKDQKTLLAIPRLFKDSTFKLPSSVENINYSLLSSLKHVKEVEVPSGNSFFYSEDGVLFNKDKSELIYYPRMKTDSDYCVPNGVTEIASPGFSGNTFVTNIVLPETLLSFSGRLPNPFSSCSSLNKINIPKNIKSLPGVFDSCFSLETLVLPENLEQLTLVPSSGFQHIHIPKNVSVLTFGSGSCDYLEDLTIDDANTSFAMHNGAVFSKDFSRLLYLPQNRQGDFTVPKQTKSIMLPYENNRNLFENFFVEDGNESFFSLDGILYKKSNNEIINIPGAKEELHLHSSLSNHNLAPLENVKTVYLDKNINTFISGTLFLMPNLTKIIVAEDNESLLEENGYLFNQNKENLVAIIGAKTEVTIPEYIKEINLLALPKNVEIVTFLGPVQEEFKTIGLNNSPNLKEIHLGKNYSGRLFTTTNCPNLKEITVHPDNPNFYAEDGAIYDFQRESLLWYSPEKHGAISILPSVKTIASYAIQGYKQNEIIFPEGITKIDPRAISYCPFLRKVVIPDSVTQIGAAQLWQCNPTWIYFGRGIKSLSKGTLQLASTYSIICFANSESQVDLAKDWYLFTPFLEPVPGFGRIFFDTPYGSL